MFQCSHSAAEQFGNLIITVNIELLFISVNSQLVVKSSNQVDLAL